MKLRQVSPEVFYDSEPLVTVDAADIGTLKARAAEVPRRRSRLCSHPEPAALIHEMLIVHESSAYVRPHRHLNRAESFHVIEGEGDIVLFDASGVVLGVIQLGDYRSGKTFYYRMPEATFHGLIVRSPVMVFHEVTSGPFDPRTTEFPEWAPADESPGVAAFLAGIEANIANFKKRRT